MSDYLAVFVEDNPPAHNFIHPRELDVHSAAPVEQIAAAAAATTNPKLKVIEVERIEPDGQELHSRRGTNAEGIPVTRHMFNLQQRDDSFPFACRAAPFSLTTNTPNAYASLTLRGGTSARLDKIAFAANGNELTLERSYGGSRPHRYHYHRVPTPDGLHLAA
jgi:hypothetical protein